MPRVPYPELYDALLRAMLRLGFDRERAELSARLFAETTRDGVYTHGLNRFPRLAAMVANGSLDVRASPTWLAGTGGLERWDGHRGPGNLNAHAAMTRTIELARQHGMGGVALGNTNHWMRGGTYGWMAAEAGLFAMCWSNTLANLPPWGAKTPALGNTPFVIAVPRSSGHVVVDLAMSQFSYGTLSAYAKRGAPLPVPGGYDTNGELTTDAAAIEASQRALPIGYWKGSGLSLVLDMMAAMLSGGLATHQIPRDSTRESGISQMFLAIDPSSVATRDELNRVADGIVASLAAATPVDPARPVRYPGEETARVREENMRLGVPVEDVVWDMVNNLSF